MDGEVGQVQKEGPFAMLADEANGGLIENVREVGAGRGPIEAGHIAGLFAERGKVLFWRSLFIPADIQIKALFPRPESWASQVPLADVPRGIPGRLKSLRQGHFGQRQLFFCFRLCQAMKWHVIAAGEPVGDVQTGRPFARHQCRSRGGADRRGCVGLREPHSLRGQPVDMRRLVIPAAVAAQVRPAQVIEHDQDDIRSRVSFARSQVGGVIAE